MNNAKLASLKKEIRSSMLETMDFTREVSDEEVLNALDSMVTELSNRQYISIRERQKIKKEVFNSLRRFDVLQELLEDENITEIMVNGPDNIFIEKAGRIEKAEICFESVRRLEDIAQQMAAAANRRINEASPIVDTRLDEYDARVSIVLNPVSLCGPAITIRKFKHDIMSMEKLIEIGAISEEAAAFLQKLVRSGYNILVSGGTGSGKTTFLNALSNYIDPSERVITIEDAAELQLQNLPNMVRLETRNANVEGKNEVTIRDLLKASLRMRPDRIIVGECRGAEAADMLTACNTGHDGSLSTIHANTAADVIGRLETMVLMGTDIPLSAVRKQISSAIDIIVQLGRMRDKSRRVLEICEVYGEKNGRAEIVPLYSFKESGRSENGEILGSLEKKGELRRTDKLERSGWTV